jgi:hypothetical protein
MRASFLACVVLIAGSAIGTMAEQREKWVGRVSDTQCGRAVNAECNKKCINSGIPPVLVLDGTDEVLPIANSETVKRYAGEHVEITGTLAGLRRGASRLLQLPAPRSIEEITESPRITLSALIALLETTARTSCCFPTTNRGWCGSCSA